MVGGVSWCRNSPAKLEIDMFKFLIIIFLSFGGMAIAADSPQVTDVAIYEYLSPGSDYGAIIPVVTPAASNELVSRLEIKAVPPHSIRPLEVGLDNIVVSGAKLSATTVIATENMTGHYCLGLPFEVGLLKAG